MGSAASKPEERARERIDAQLAAVGWAVQSRDELSLSAARGVAVLAQFPLVVLTGLVTRSKGSLPAAQARRSAELALAALR